MRIDHVTVAGRELAALEARCRGEGLEPVYGGAHSNGVTHMSIVSLADGAYVELISTVESGRTDAPWWGRHIASDAGPCAWALAVDDVAAEVRRVRALGVAVRGPFEMSRALPDGRVAEWTLAYLGDGEPGSRLPFVIQDRTPRRVRVPRAAPGAHAGVATVVVGVESLAPAIALYRSVFGLPEPVMSGRLARFEGTPVALVEAESELGSGPLRFELDPAPGHAGLAITRDALRNRDR